MNNNKKTIVLIVVLIALLAILSVLGYKQYKNREIDEPKNSNNVVDTKDASFNVNIIKKVDATQKGNYLISPYSIEIALKMVKDGANGETYNQVNNLIGERDIPTFMAKERINVANGAFITNKYKPAFESSYYEKLKKYNADLIFDEYNTPNPINEWVSKQTYGMIPKLMDEISPYFAFGLANAVAIDVEWDGAFKCEDTREQDFTKEDNSKIKVEMMHDSYENYGKYFKTDDATGVILDYRKYDKDGKQVFDEDEEGNYVEQEGTRLEFVGILPNGNVSDYVNSLTSDKIKEIDNKTQLIKDMKNTVLSVHLPRFSYEFELTPFAKILNDMGMKDAFDKGKADFTNIVSRDTMQKMGVENIYIDTAIHKTYIDLNEKGTKAAAVTYFGFAEATSAGDDRPEPTVIEVKFDKPFIYMIRDSKTKEILFFGVVREPNVWKGSTCSNEQW